jgi:hypothetical protein
MSWISARKSGNAAWNIANNTFTPSFVGGTPGIAE